MRRAILSLFWVVVGLFFGGSNSWAEETAQEEAIRRIPPVLHSLTIPDKLISGESYTITWSLVGYESDYKTIVVFFDCTDVASPNCGNAYSNPKLEASDKLTATSVGVGAWSYQGTSSFRLDYSYTFTPTVTADTETVIRFYYLNEADNANDRPSISLMAPGNLVHVSPYDTSGRRLATTILAADSLPAGAPQISSLEGETVLQNSTVSKTVTVSDLETPNQDLTLSVTSSNQTLVPHANIYMGSTGENRTLTLVLAEGQAGSTTITVTVRDGDANVASRSFVLSTINDLPEALDGTLTTDEDTVATGTLSATDTNGDALVYSIVTNGSKGTATITDTAMGEYSYTPHANENGTDTFTFKVNDGTTDSNTATVTVTITPVNDPPEVNAGSNQTVNENATVTLTGSGSDLDGSISSYAWTQVSGTTVTLSGADTATPTFTAPLSGTAEALTFRLLITDNNGATQSQDVTVTIDPVGRVLSVEDVTATEGNSGDTTHADFTVSLNLAVLAEQTITVDYATSDSGSAAAGTDYTATSGTLTFAAGESSKILSVPVLGDTMDEADEAFTLTLSNPIRATIRTATATGTITDDDSEPTVHFSRADQSAEEGRQVTVTLQLSEASGLDVSVPFTVSGTATEEDYTGLSASPVTISAGSTSVDVALTVSSDSVGDGGETLIFSMETPTYATLGATTTHTITLSDVAVALAPVPKTGQTTSYIAKDDGALQKGVAWPDPRFVDNDDGTVTDNLTGLIWMKNASCWLSVGWSSALSKVADLNGGSVTCGGYSGVYTDWRLPDRRELFSLVDYEQHNPALPAGHLFSGVQSSNYWSSTTNANNTTNAWLVYLDYGSVYSSGKSDGHYVWPVRGGQ